MGRDHDAAVRVRLHQSSSLKAMADPSLGALARAYVEGHLDLEGDVRDILALGDRLCNAADCAPSDGTLWSAPSAILDLAASGGATTAFTWPAPAQPGGSAPVTYDVLRSDGAIFGGAICLESGTASTSSLDSDEPTEAFFYLLGARNGCGRTIAPDSAGSPRGAPPCPP